MIFLGPIGIHRKSNLAPLSYSDFQEPKFITILDLDYNISDVNNNNLETENRDVGQKL